jgi:hypothetical protein
MKPIDQVPYCTNLPITFPPHFLTELVLPCTNVYRIALFKHLIVT